VVGEVGNFVFSVNFETFSAYGAAIDKLYQIPHIKTCAPTDLIQWT
jgi:hypothetical protein